MHVRTHAETCPHRLTQGRADCACAHAAVEALEARAREALADGAFVGLLPRQSAVAERLAHREETGVLAAAAARALDRIGCRWCGGRFLLPLRRLAAGRTARGLYRRAGT